MSPTPSVLPINPGGTLPPDQVLGRDAVIAHYWEALSVQSIALLAPRRVGKTSIGRKMVAEPPPTFIARLRDLEGMQRASEFVKALYGDVEELLPGSTKFERRARGLMEKLTGSVEVTGFKLQIAEQDWRDLLDAVLHDLDRHAASQDRLIVLFWDEERALVVAG